MTFYRSINWKAVYEKILYDKIASEVLVLYNFFNIGNVRIGD